MGCTNQKKQPKLKDVEMIPLPPSSKSCGLVPKGRVGDTVKRATLPCGSCSALPTLKGSAGDIMEKEAFSLPPHPTAIFCHGSSVLLGEDHLVTSKSLNTPGRGLGPVAWPNSCPYPPAGTALAQLSPGIRQSPSWHWPTPCWGAHLQQESGHPWPMLKAVTRSWFTLIITNYH